MTRNNNNNNRNNNNKRNNKKPQLYLLAVNLPPKNNGEEIFTKLLKQVDHELIMPDDSLPSDIIKKTFDQLNPFQKYMLYANISEKDIEKLKDVADVKISKNDDERLKNLLKLSEETEPVELTGRFFCTIDFLINQHQNNNWLVDFQKKLQSASDQNLLLKLAIKMANHAPMEAIGFINSLKYYFLNNKLEAIK